jgi:hypothetical protein
VLIFCWRFRLLAKQLLLFLLMLNQAVLFLVFPPLLLPKPARFHHSFGGQRPFRPQRQRTAFALGGGG